jgi:hypothetical protein
MIGATPKRLGTVRTHIALLQGQPYATFSGADRSIDMLWRTPWKAKGVFCVLYTASEVTCEVGDSFLGSIVYGTATQTAQVHNPNVSVTVAAPLLARALESQRLPSTGGAESTAACR